MAQTVYKRIDTAELAGPRSAPPGGDRAGVRWFILPLSVVLCVLQAVVTIYANNTQSVQITSTLIAVVAMGALFVAVLLINPLLRLVYLGNLLRRE